MIRQYHVYKTTYLITDEEKFLQLMGRIEILEKAKKTYQSGDVWRELFETFPAQSKGARVGNTIAIFREGWDVIEVTEENITEIRKLCHIGTVTHELNKLSLSVAA